METGRGLSLKPGFSTEVGAAPTIASSFTAGAAGLSVFFFLNSIKGSYGLSGQRFNFVND
jgi:hypothetical protein